MEVRGQRMLEERIEDLIGQLKKGERNNYEKLFGLLFGTANELC